MYHIVEINSFILQVYSSLRSDMCAESTLDKYRGTLRIGSSIMKAEFEVVLTIALMKIHYLIGTRNKAGKMFIGNV